MEQPAEQLANEETFQEMLKVFAPDLYLVYEAQKMTGVNWEVIREVIGSIHDVASFGGWGEVRIFIEHGDIGTVQGGKTRKMGIPALIDASSL